MPHVTLGCTINHHARPYISHLRRELAAAAAAGKKPIDWSSNKIL
ncbi:hypothetical protein QEV83_00725 [Methylocapsa sp. D3K7]|nr:hypothetical protein [Methylocapsa sp. D3K7]WGJ14880.1 hypothetical protein QEV83_00725 [Methylocapsa sp. D3K7]